MFISPDLQKNIKDVIDSNCKELNNQCFQSVRDVLVNPKTELQARGLLLFVVAICGIINSIIIPLFYNMKQPVPVPLHLSPGHLSQASAAASATAIVVVPGSGTPPITITPTPEPTTITG